MIQTLKQNYRRTVACIKFRLVHLFGTRFNDSGFPKTDTDSSQYDDSGGDAGYGLPGIIGPRNGAAQVSGNTAAYHSTVFLNAHGRIGRNLLAVDCGAVLRVVEDVELAVLALFNGSMITAHGCS